MGLSATLTQQVSKGAIGLALKYAADALQWEGRELRPITLGCSKACLL